MKHAYLDHHRNYSRLSADGTSFAPASLRRNVTDTGIDLTEPELYEAVNVDEGSSSATIISMAVNYGMDVYGRFIGSLRKTGFQGHIILAVDKSDLSPEVLQYFEYRNVSYRIVEMIPAEECVVNGDRFMPIVRAQPCSKAYPYMKATWARHSLFRDWLQECETCTGPVLYIDSRDTYFQADPFGPGATVTGLQVYQVDRGASTDTPFVADAMKSCTGIAYNERMLCAGVSVDLPLRLLSAAATEVV